MTIEVGDLVEISGWPHGPLPEPLVARVMFIASDDEVFIPPVLVVLLTGTARFPAGEHHSFPQEMLLPVIEHEQIRIV